MPPTTPYTPDLDNREPIRAMRETTARIRAVAGEWSPDQFERSLRARQVGCAADSDPSCAERNCVRLPRADGAHDARLWAQSFDQDGWMARESKTSGHDALDAFLGVAAMNIALFASLSDADRERRPFPPGLRFADGRLDHSPDGRPPDSSPDAARSDRRAVGTLGGRAGGRDGQDGRDGPQFEDKKKGREVSLPPLLPFPPILPAPIL